MNGNAVENTPEPSKPNQKYADSVYKNGLGFNTTMITDDNKDSNPLTPAIGTDKNLNVTSELMVASRKNGESNILYNYYNQDENDKTSDILDDSKLDSQSSYISLENNPYVSSRMAALDLDGDGYDDTVAETSLLSDLKNANLHFINAKTGEKYEFSMSYNIKSSQIKQRYAGAFIVLASGDIDGDGKDELALYRPSEEYTITSGNSGYNNSAVVIYDVEIRGNDIKMTEIAAEIIDKEYELEANKSLPQIVDIEMADVDGDGTEEMLATSSPNEVYSETIAVNNYGSYFAIYDFKENMLQKQFSRRLAFTGNDYGVTNDATVANRVMQSVIFAGLTVGDLNNDGHDEVIVGVYASFWQGGILANYYEIVQFGYNYTTKEYEALYGGIPYSVKPSDYIRRCNTAFIKDEVFEPLAVQAFATRGNGYGDTLFIGDSTFIYESGTPDSDAFNTYYNAGVTEIYTMPVNGSSVLTEASKNRFTNDNGYVNLRQSDDKTVYSRVSYAVAGNFDGNAQGKEQLAAVVFNGKYSVDNMTKPEIANDSTAFFECDISVLSRISDANATGKYSVTHKDKVSASERFDSFTAICALDYDNDGTIVEYAGSDYYFSDPSVVAVLQASPYYADIESLDGNYSTNGGTAFGKTKATGSSRNTEFNVSAGVIAGFEQDFSFFGLADVAGIEFNLEASVNAGYGEEISKEVEHGTTYNASPLNNSVVLSMTPYKRYKYWMYIPTYTLPTENEYMQMTQECNTYYENYREAAESGNLDKAKYEYNKYINSYNAVNSFEKVIDEKNVEITYRSADNQVKKKEIDVDYGTTVEGYWTPYYICIPDEPRMSLVTTEKYDQVAENEGLEKIDGNILTNTPGNPYSYASDSSGYRNFDGGQMIQSNASTDGFVNAGFGAGNTISQKIDTSESKTKTYSFGTAIDMETKFKVMGVVAGVTMSAETNKGIAYTDTSGTSFEGTVASSPSDNYSFNWRFGKWDASVNGNDCIVLGYLVKNQVSPAALPKNINVADTTQSAVTITWDTPDRMNDVEGYVIDMVQDDSSKKNITDIIPAGRIAYVIDDLAPGTAYTFEIRTVTKGETDLNDIKCEYSLPINCRTMYKPGEGAPDIIKQPSDQLVLADAPAELKVSVKRIAESVKPIKYQWQVRKSADELFKDIDSESALTNTLNIPSVPMSESGYEYRCLISQDYQSVTRTVISDVVTVRASESKEEVEAFNRERETDTDTETTKESVTDITTETTKEPSTDATTETTKEPTTDVTTETTKEPTTGVTIETTKEPTTDVMTETTKESETGVTTKPDEDVTTKTETETTKGSDSAPKETKITINKKSASMVVGGKLKLKVTVKKYGKKVSVSWKSSNSKIAKVSSDGTVTAKKSGTATITVKTSDGKSVKCKVKIKAAPSKVTLNKNRITLVIKKTYTVKPKIPKKTYTTYLYKSSNTKVATVNNKGKIVAKKAGTAKITVITANGKKATCTVKVVRK